MHEHSGRDAGDGGVEPVGEGDRLVIMAVPILVGQQTDALGLYFEIGGGDLAVLVEITEAAALRLADDGHEGRVLVGHFLAVELGAVLDRTQAVVGIEPVGKVADVEDRCAPTMRLHDVDATGAVEAEADDVLQQRLRRDEVHLQTGRGAEAFDGRLRITRTPGADGGIGFSGDGGPGSEDRGEQDASVRKAHAPRVGGGFGLSSGMRAGIPRSHFTTLCNPHHQRTSPASPRNPGLTPRGCCLSLLRSWVPDAPEVS